MLAKWKIPKCPNCGQRLYICNKSKTIYGFRTLTQEENWECITCDESFTREVEYVLKKIGDWQE